MYRIRHFLTFFSIALLIFSGPGLFSQGNAASQALKGQWTGSFVTAGDIWGGKTEYIMEIDVKGTQVEGYSYTYFIISGKRHYVICRLEGTYDKGSRSITVTEVAKVKSNTPPDFKDMFQTHRLTYLKQGDFETLEGKWSSASSNDPLQKGDTKLERRLLAKVNPSTAPSQQTLASSKPISPAKPPSSSTLAANKTAPSKQTSTSNNSSLAKTPSQPIASANKPNQPAVNNRETPSELALAEKKPEQAQKPPAPVAIEAQASTPASPVMGPRLDLRSNKLIQVIEVDQSDFTVELYDNGSVDGDTISLFYNNKLMVYHKKLSTTPITLEITLDRGRKDNELVMFAESMGEIPPNTALMVVKAKDKRYEVNITSTEQTNGAVRFRLKE